jgi:tRNA (guanine9-N1)-methyltransferase
VFRQLRSREVKLRACAGVAGMWLGECASGGAYFVDDEWISIQLHLEIWLLSSIVANMESEERPAKMRKLQHKEEEESPLNSDVSATNTAMEAQPPLDTAEEETSAAFHEAPETEVAEPKLSKSALKKKRRLEEWEAGRESRKIKRREKVKEKKERKREAWKEENADENGNVPKMPPARLPRHTAGIGTQVPITIIFDCDFEDLMYDNELKSLGQQITRCYSDNRKAKFRTHLALSSFGGKMKERFNGLLAQQYTSWKGFRFFEEDFVGVAEKSKEWMTGPQGGTVAGALLQSKEHDDEQHDGQPTEETTEGEIIYLSSESDNILTHLKPNSTYIIGGLVDKNRHKGVCYKRAVNRGIKTAKLPIKEYLEMRDRQVLVTNHVMEILLKWMEFGDWGQAFMEVIPQRKGGKLRKDGGAEQATESPEVEGQADSEMVEAAEEAEADAEEEAGGSALVPETEVIEVTKHLPVEDTEDD